MVLGSSGVTMVPPVLTTPVGIFDQSGLCIDMPLRMCWGVACPVGGVALVALCACMLAAGPSGASNILVVVGAAGVAVWAKAHICASVRTITHAIAPIKISRRLLFINFS